jgi:hypothetical protein
MVAVIGCLGLIILMHHKVVAQIIDDEPNFLVIAEGESEGLSVDLTLYRQNGRVSGFGKIMENGQRTFLAVRDATLCTDNGQQNPILQTDDEQAIGVWTPACVDVEVKLLRPPYHTRIVRLSECEPENTQVCELGGGVTDRQGSCLGDSNRDTIQWEIGTELPGETIIIVPQIQVACWNMQP